MGVVKNPPMPKLKMQMLLASVVLSGISLIIGGILVIYLFRDMVDNLIKAELPLREGGQVTESWLNPPVRPLMRIYFFNTTNPEGYLKGGKPHLQEMGPYTWEEKWEKVGVSWTQEGELIKYGIKKYFRFRPDLSAGSVDDAVTVPNIPMFASLYQLRYNGKLVLQALSSMLGILKQEAFNATTVGDLVWGYDHPLVKLGNEVLPKEKKLPFDKFGFFVDKNGSVDGEYVANTGINNVANLGKMFSFKGKKKMDFWDSEECNAIEGTDGTIFHPDVRQNDTLRIFNMELCQSLPLVYQEEVKHHGINTFRFVPPSNVFGTPAENSRNQCYCKHGQCAPSGLFNVSTCQFGAPLLLSWPHFFQADPALVDAVSGLSPNKEDHQFHVDILPKMGIGMRAAVRTQINLDMLAYPDVKQMKGVRNLTYPILWFQTGLDGISDEDTIALLNMAVVTPEVARNVMIPVFFVTGSLLLISVIAFLVRKYFLTGEDSKEPKDIPLPTKQGDRSPPPDYAQS